MNKNEIEINLKHPFPLLSCKECGFEFAIIAIIRGIESGTYGGQDQIEMILARVRFCPQCKADWPERK